MIGRLSLVEERDGVFFGSLKGKKSLSQKAPTEPVLSVSLAQIGFTLLISKTVGVSVIGLDRTWYVG